MAFPRIPRRWRLRALMIVVALCAMGLLMYRVSVERAPVYRLIRQLRMGNVQARIQAAVQLGLMGPKAAFADQALIAALDDPDPSVRTEATYALVEIGSRSPRMLRTLVAELERWPARRSASVWPASSGHDPVAALKVIRPDATAIVPLLKGALKSPDHGIRRRAVEVLCAAAGWSGPASPETAEALIGVLDDEWYEYRKWAVEALARMDREVQRKAVARLTIDLRGLESSRSLEAAQLLPMLADGVPSALAALMEEARGADEVHRLTALFLLGRYGELATPAAPAILRVITGRDAERMFYLSLDMRWRGSLGRSGYPESGQVFPSLPGQTSAVALGVRALQAMGGAVEQRAVRELIAILRDPDGGDEQRRGAAVALGEFGLRAAEAIPVLVGVIRAKAEAADRGPDPADEGSMSLRALATTALGRIGSEGDEKVVALLAGLLEADDAGVRNFAAIALERLRNYPRTVATPLFSRISGARTGVLG